jgi:hypothetical protein
LPFLADQSFVLGPQQKKQTTIRTVKPMRFVSFLLPSPKMASSLKPPNSLLFHGGRVSELKTQKNSPINMNIIGCYLLFNGKKRGKINFF